MLFLYAIFGFIILGNIVLFLIYQKDSAFLKYLERNNYYMVYHIILTCYLLPLGEYGKALREKSFGKALASVSKCFQAAAGNIKEETYADLKETGSGKGDPVTIMEVGVGPGVNFDYYPEKCDVIIVEPAAEFRKAIEEKFKNMKGRRLIKYIQSGGENIAGVEDNSVDAVISSELLCSVNDAKKVVDEIYRVLKPGGRYYFFEHIFDKPGKPRRLIQTVLNMKYLWPSWYLGCTFHNTDEVIAASKFSENKGRQLYVPFKESIFLSCISPHYCGYVTK